MRNATEDQGTASVEKDGNKEAPCTDAVHRKVYRRHTYRKETPPNQSGPDAAE